MNRKGKPDSHAQRRRRAKARALHAFRHEPAPGLIDLRKITPRVEELLKLLEANKLNQANEDINQGDE